MIGDPTSAPPRPDLGFLRHRSHPKPAPAESQVADFVSGRAPHPPRHTEPTGAAATPRPSSSLDLSEQATSPPADSAVADFVGGRAAHPPRHGEPAPAAATPRPSSSLDLSDEPIPSSAQSAKSAQPPVPALPLHADTRIRAGEQHLLTLKEPTVTLTRVQSGVGQLQIEAVCSPEVGDLRLGAVYHLHDGASSTVQLAGGSRFGPSSSRPVLAAGRDDDYEVVRIDLRSARLLERVAIYAFSESRTELTWGGTLVITTFGRARVELPLETLHPGRVAVLASIYNLDGEFVIRAEMETIYDGDVRDAARAYGYDRITWRDDRLPAD
ncbi:MAG TPA: hypothetical protein VE442_10520 [Jatrophihabitans sp.]|nr:hypothetical protein [Jatrophihabitans sp.]